MWRIAGAVQRVRVRSWALAAPALSSQILMMGALRFSTVVMTSRRFSWVVFFVVWVRWLFVLARFLASRAAAARRALRWGSAGGVGGSAVRVVVVGVGRVSLGDGHDPLVV